MSGERILETRAMERTPPTTAAPVTKAAREQVNIGLQPSSLAATRDMELLCTVVVASSVFKAMPMAKKDAIAGQPRALSR